MVNVCSYKYDSIAQKYGNPTIGNFIFPQKLIPFDNKSKKGWCEYHRKWEVVSIFPDGRKFFSCGFEVPANIGLNRDWNKNQVELIVDTDNFILRINERFSWIDVNENEIYQTFRVNSKIIDVRVGTMCHPKNFDLEKVPEEVNEKINKVIASFCKKIYGIELHSNTSDFIDFLKYPTCPNFNKITKKIDCINKYNFRFDLNLFKDFCKLIQIKETKRLRKDFQKDPKLLFLHALAEFIGFTDANAVKPFVESENLYRVFADNLGVLRISLKNRCIYASDSPNLLVGLRLWVQNALTDKSQSIVVKRFIKFFKDTNYSEIKDAVEIYEENARNLPVAFHERILKEGFTTEMHDQLVQFFGNDENDANVGFSRDCEKLGNKEITYDKNVFLFEDWVEGFDEPDYEATQESIALNRLMMEKAAKKENTNTLNLDNQNEEIVDDLTDFEAVVDDRNVRSEVEEDLTKTEIRDFSLGTDILKKGKDEDYFFALPRDTDELYEISSKMRNCVGYLYRNKVLDGSSIIVVLIYKNKMKACLEIKQNKATYHYEIVQAKGFANGPISLKYRRAIEDWKKRKNIKGQIQYKK